MSGALDLDYLKCWQQRLQLRHASEKIAISRSTHRQHWRPHRLYFLVGDRQLVIVPHYSCQRKCVIVGEELARALALLQGVGYLDHALLVFSRPPPLS